MNKNQRRARAEARSDGRTNKRPDAGQTTSVSRNYNATCTPSGKTTSASFISRTIPFTRQPRLSKKAKVGRPGRNQ